MDKPEWKDAPPWARYLAMDSDGSWGWYENCPRDGSSFWVPTGGRYKTADSAKPWHTTLEEKPT